jgi:hypothetical protein
MTFSYGSSVSFIFLNVKMKKSKRKLIGKKKRTIGELRIIENNLKMLTKKLKKPKRWLIKN